MGFIPERCPLPVEGSLRLVVELHGAYLGNPCQGLGGLVQVLVLAELQQIPSVEPCSPGLSLIALIPGENPGAGQYFQFPEEIVQSRDRSLRSRLREH